MQIMILKKEGKISIYFLKNDKIFILFNNYLFHGVFLIFILQYNEVATLSQKKKKKSGNFTVSCQYIRQSSPLDLSLMYRTTFILLVLYTYYTYIRLFIIECYTHHIYRRIYNLFSQLLQYHVNNIKTEIEKINCI